ncbi:MAG TPA: tyrosine-type recombinase/integrase [Acidimicrobiales bacterium]|nr:tyrosine-type recombinase/integrase [Acidimicrobiales bacterium]
MRGSIVKRGAGYTYVLELGRDAATGKRRQKWVGGFRTKREAEAALTAALGRLQAGQFADPGRTTVGEFLEHWLDSVAPTLRETTAASYRATCVNWVIPSIGSLRLASLTPGHLTQLYASLTTNGGTGGRPLSARSVRYAHVVLGRAMKDAVEWGMLARNPVRSAHPPRVDQPVMRVWDVAQARQFIASVAGDRLEAMWVVLITTGLRRGEAAGLRWEDVDFDAGTLAVRRALVSVGYEVKVTEPKTAKGRRSVALDDLTVRALRAHRARQAEEALAAGDLWERTGYVFVRDDGRPLHPERIGVMFAQRVKASGLPPIRLHDLRHTSATLALAAGVHPKIVQERLGHASISITLDTYSHVVAGLQHEAAQRVADLLAVPSDPSTAPAS